MSPKFRSVFVLLLILVGLWLYQTSFDNKSVLTKQKESIATEVPFPVTHYRQADIQDGIAQYPPRTQSLPPNKVIGGVVSHHLLAQLNIARYFQNIGLNTYKRIVIIGPNHGELGENHLVTSDRPWDTPFGLVSADNQLVSNIINDGGAYSDDGVLENDHAIEVLIPFVKIYLPNTQVVPILVSSKTTTSEIEKLVGSLIKSEDTLFLVSSDFSHYLLPNIAKKKDEETLMLIKSFQIDRIRRLVNDHLDSPQSLAILLRIMQELNIKNLEVFDHTDGSTIAKSPHSPTTSYFFLNYYENPRSL